MSRKSRRKRKSKHTQKPRKTPPQRTEKTSNPNGQDNSIAHQPLSQNGSELHPSSQSKRPTASQQTSKRSQQNKSRVTSPLISPNESAPSSRDETSPSSWSQRLRSWTLQILLFGLVFFAISAFQNRNLLASGTPAPFFRLRALDGKIYQLSDYRGKRVILHFWTTWCSVCKTNINTFRDLAPSYRNDPVFLSVVTDGHQLNAIRRLHRQKQINYPILLANRQLAQRYKLNRYPTTYFLDRRGHIAAKDSGYLTSIGLFWRSLWVRAKQSLFP